MTTTKRIRRARTTTTPAPEAPEAIGATTESAESADARRAAVGWHPEATEATEATEASIEATLAASMVEAGAIEATPAPEAPVATEAPIGLALLYPATERPAAHGGKPWPRLFRVGTGMGMVSSRLLAGGATRDELLTLCSRPVWGQVVGGMRYMGASGYVVWRTGTASTGYRYHAAPAVVGVTLPTGLADAPVVAA